MKVGENAFQCLSRWANVRTSYRTSQASPAASPHDILHHRVQSSLQTGSLLMCGAAVGSRVSKGQDWRRCLGTHEARHSHLELVFLGSGDTEHWKPAKAFKCWLHTPSRSTRGFQTVGDSRNTSLCTNQPPNPPIHLRDLILVNGLEIL